MKTASFNTEFVHYKAQLYAYILGLIKDEDVSKDLIQELYLKLYKNRKRIKEENARLYFFSSAKNLCLDWFRNTSRVQTISFSMEHDVGYHESTELKELQQHFRKSIDALPPNYREVIYLKDVCGLETNEVVEVTGLTENNMRVLLSRARAKVKENLLNMYAYESIRK